MKRMKGLPRRLTLPFVAGGLLALALCTSAESFGEPGVLSGSGAVRSLDAGINSYQEGAIEAAVETLSDALFQGELSQQQFAEAFYYRGLAYRELGKPGQAITDLSKAMSFKNGLSKAHLKEAMRNRTGAYREAGLAAGERVVAADPSDGSRIPVPFPAGQAPGTVTVAEDQLRQPDSSPTNSTGSAPPPIPPETKGDFVSSMQKLIPDWP
jgi:tetratricopeptide (TPR) repeat protein